MLTCLLALSSAVSPVADRLRLPDISVVTRRAEAGFSLPLSVYRTEVEPGHDHPNEVLVSAPGAWISRGSGQEHLTAIRSPVLTGPGACGAFLYLENGVPIRPSGFCNVNNLFELVWEQAAAVEVVAGPGSALYGANALHGAINVEMPAPGRGSEIGLQLAADDYRAVSATLSGDQLLATALAAHAGSFRQDEYYDQQKLHLRARSQHGAIAMDHWFSATNLNQETAGYIFGRDSYRDPVLRRSNVNPEASRDASSYRAASRWRWSAQGMALEVTPFARSSRMKFRQHFLPGKPLETNGQDSVGLQFLLRGEQGLRWTAGFDLDYADGFLREFQPEPITDGSAFLQETRPAGLHYDYTATALMTALYGETVWTLPAQFELAAGLRLERIEYDYDNHLAAGNLRPDGSACGFGGCIFSRPADRRDSFTELAPKLALSRELGAGQRAYLRFARGFRPPQTTELYRLQRGQLVAELDSEKLDSAELGYKWVAGRWAGSIAGWAMEKRNFIFNDAEGFNVSDGRTEHHGLDLDLHWRQGVWSADANAQWARHRYAVGSTDAAGEVFVAGNDVDTAPRHMLQLRLAHAALWGGRGELQWIDLGGYYLDAANQHRYPGHELLHLRWQRQFGDWGLSLGIENALDSRYAERADFAFGQHRYFPGQDRSWFVGLRYSG